MKLTHVYILGAAAAALTACHGDDELTPHYTVGEEHNVIALRAGVSDGAGTQTRAGAEELNHALHQSFSTGTQIALRIDGTWTGHSPSEDVKTKTIATLGVPSGTGNLHNNVTAYAPTVFWDDYGTADPANATGRAGGLTIYGAAINGKTSLPSTLSSLDNTSTSWKTLPWTIAPDQKAKGLADYDLLTSCNVKPEPSPAVTYAIDGTYKFEERGAGKLLEFTHAMTKITVKLTAGDGFRNNQFADVPTVTLLGFHNEGTVDIEQKVSTPSTDTRDDITMWLSEGGKGAGTATLEALVFPQDLSKDEDVFASTSTILTLTADGNTFTVTAAKLLAAIAAERGKTGTRYHVTSDHLVQGWNYILQIRVNKTDISLTATIRAWDDVTAVEEAPKIQITNVYGHPDSEDDCQNFARGFDLYRSTSLTGSYISGDAVANHTVVSYASATGYTQSPQLYWPNHQTHYFFRGVWPVVDSKDDSDEPLGPTKSQVKANAIDVKNEKYHVGYYPSDLMIGRPLLTDDETPDETCRVHTSPATQGICATEGQVHINFRYMMSQVKVELESETTDPSAKVTFDKDTRVEIIGGYAQGVIKLSDCTSDFTGQTTAPYALHNVASTDYDSYHDAVIPQAIADLRFRISIKSGVDGSGVPLYDVYECAVKDIKVKEGTADPALITAWQRGKIYTYTLNVTKTALAVTATLRDWITVEASTDVWF